MKPLVKPPRDCSPHELDAFERLVLEGGEVSPAGLGKRIAKAERLVFCESDPVLGVGAVKNPGDRYKTAVFAKAGVPDRADDFRFELGWLYVSPEARGKGVGNDLMAATIAASGTAGIFATTRANNHAMHHLFEKFSFERLGSEYPSSNGDYHLVLYGCRTPKS